MRISDLKSGGHAPSLVSAFLHFDISFMVWVVLGALMPFLTTDATLTGTNLLITPTAAVSRPGQYTVLIRGLQPRPGAEEASQAHGYQLLIKPGDPATATRSSVKPVESYVLDNSNPATLAALNARSERIRVALAPGVHQSPNENILPLKPGSVLAKEGKNAQAVATGYSAGVKLTLIGIPLLAAGFWRILLGLLVDRSGSRRVGTLSLLATLLPLVLGWRAATTYNQLACIGFFLGIAGASFAVSLPLASRWYPPHLQGLVMGIAGAGNSGTVLATLFAPMLARTLGWHAVMGLLMIPVAVTLLVFSFFAKDPPRSTEPATFSDYARLMRDSDSVRFCILYFVTFGGFVGLSSFLNTFFVDQFDAPKAAVGLWTWPFIIGGSFLRPVGGALADRIGGIRMLSLLYTTAAVCAVGVGLFLHSFVATSLLLFVLMGCLGMGNGSVFQLVPQRFGQDIGVMTGVIGAAGGIGGYYLNFALGHLHDITHTYASGFYAFAAITVVAFSVLRAVAPAWTRSWLGAGGIARREQAVATA